MPAGTNDGTLRGVLSAGQRVPLLNCDDGGLFGCGPLRLESTVTLRSVPDAPLAGGGQGPALGLGLVQDAELPLRPGLALRAGVDVGDRLGVAAPLAPGGSGLAVKARAGLGSDFAELGIGLPLRLDLTVAVVHDLGPAPAGVRPDDCTGVLDIRWKKLVPLRLTAACGQGEGNRFSFGLRGIF